MKPTNPHRATPTASAIAGLILTLSAGAAIADSGLSTGAAVFYERAPVIRSVPVYASVAHPVRECTQGYERQADPASSSGSAVNQPMRTVLGAVIGGLAGSTIGKGNGRVAAAAVGAAAGAVIGNNWGDGSSSAGMGAAGAGEPREVLVERCRMVDRWRQEVVGHDVTYLYHGRELTARTDRDPGAEVGVRVTVEVAADEGAQGR